MDEAQNDVKNAAKVEARVKALGEENNLPKVAIDKYREAFEIFDPEGDGALSEEAIGKVVEAVNQTIPPDEFEIMWFESMADDSTDFDFACFLQFMLALQLRDKGVTPHKLRGLMSQNSPTSPGPFSLGPFRSLLTFFCIQSFIRSLCMQVHHPILEPIFRYYHPRIS